MDWHKFGIKTELEHKKTFSFIKDYYKKKHKFPTDKIIAEHIVADHLKERKDYYKQVKKCKL